MRLDAVQHAEADADLGCTARAGVLSQAQDLPGRKTRPKSRAEFGPGTAQPKFQPNRASFVPPPLSPSISQTDASARM